MIADIFKDKVVIVTGGANGIGRCIADEFRSREAVVYVIDKQEGEHFVGDISKKEVLFLCSDKAGFITGENICIDGGMTKQMIYHGDCGWKLENS